MFACIVVAFEVALLTAAFWYVFVRQEKPYKIIGDPWGNYSGISDPTRGQQCGEISYDCSGKVTVVSSFELEDRSGSEPRAA